MAPQMGPNSNQFAECQRVQVSRDTQAGEQVVRISLERHDEMLGWYAAGSLCVPLCQLPALEQALSELSTAECVQCTGNACVRKIIPFPLLARSIPAEPAAESVN